MKRVGVFVGSKIAPNVEKLLLNVGKMVSSEFHLDLIGDEYPTERLDRFYTQKNYDGKRGIEGVKRMKQSFYNCKKYCLEESPDLLFQITKYPIYSFPVSIVGSLHSVPTIVRLSGNHFQTYKRRRDNMNEFIRTIFMHNFLDRLPLKLADGVVVISQNIKKEAIRKGCPLSKVRLIPQPIDTKRFSPVSKEEKYRLRKELGLPKNKKIVIYVGRMSKEKGLPMLERGIGKMKKKDVLFCLIGSGEYGSHLQRNSPDLVRYEGFVKQGNIQDYYKSADLLLHPSPLEGVPNVLLEGMSTGIPVIAREEEYSRELGVPTFEDTKEMIALIENNPPFTPLPERFKWDFLKSNYIDVLNRVMDVR